MKFIVDKRVETEKPNDEIKVKYTLEAVSEQNTAVKATVTMKKDKFNVGDEIEIERSSRQGKLNE